MRSVAGITYLTSDEMRQIDKGAISEFGIDVLSLMENAGSQTANLARMILGKVAAKKVVCLVGKGNNGGDGLVAARRLHGWGANVSVALGVPKSDFRDIPAKQLATVEKLGIPVADEGVKLSGSDLLIDALLGYNTIGAPRGQVADLVRLGNISRVPILALDIPSGLDPTTGVPNDPCIVAKTTVTLGFPKLGFLNPDSRPYVGNLYLADISLPRLIYAAHGKMESVFEKESMVRLLLE